MTQNAAFLDCSCKVPTIKGVNWLPLAISGKILDEVRKTAMRVGDEKLKLSLCGLISCNFSFIIRMFIFMPCPQLIQIGQICG